MVIFNGEKLRLNTLKIDLLSSSQKAKDIDLTSASEVFT